MCVGREVMSSNISSDITIRLFGGPKFSEFIEWNWVGTYRKEINQKYSKKTKIILKLLWNYMRKESKKIAMLGLHNPLWSSRRLQQGSTRLQWHAKNRTQMKKETEDKKGKVAYLIRNCMPLAGSGWARGWGGSSEVGSFEWLINAVTCSVGWLIAWSRGNEVG